MNVLVIAVSIGAYHCAVHICSLVRFPSSSEFTYKTLQLGTKERYEESLFSDCTFETLHLSLLDGNVPAVHSFSFLAYEKQTPQILLPSSLCITDLLLLMTFLFLLLAQAS